MQNGNSPLFSQLLLIFHCIYKDGTSIVSMIKYSKILGDFYYNEKV